LRQKVFAQSIPPLLTYRYNVPVKITSTASGVGLVTGSTVTITSVKAFTSRGAVMINVASPVAST